MESTVERQTTEQAISNAFACMNSITSDKQFCVVVRIVVQYLFCNVNQFAKVQVCHYVDNDNND